MLGEIPDVCGQAARACPLVDDGKPGGFFYKPPHLLQLKGNQCAKGGMGHGSGVIILRRSDDSKTGIIAAVGPIQGKLHKLGKSHLAMFRDPLKQDVL